MDPVCGEAQAVALLLLLPPREGICGNTPVSKIRFHVSGCRLATANVHAVEIVVHETVDLETWWDRLIVRISQELLPVLHLSIHVRHVASQNRAMVTVLLALTMLDLSRHTFQTWYAVERRTLNGFIWKP